MDRLKMHSQDKARENIKKIAELFPAALTEAVIGYKPDGSPIIERAIDFEVLRQELSEVIADDRKERYQLSWPDKKKAMLLANAPTANTLRPCRGESVDFDGTGNLFIEGDNLEVLKLLLETYLGKIKVIYIDPPYNTGGDFIYADNFAGCTAEYLARSGQFDERGNRLVQNPEYSGRFHTDWLNMMYPRLKLSRDLLCDDGAIFVSIDDTEMANTVKLLGEIFGEQNKVAELVVIRAEGGGMAKHVVKGHDYLLVFAKNIAKFTPLARPKDIRGRIIEKDGEKYWVQEDWLRKEFGKYGCCHYEEILECKGERVKKEVDEKLSRGEYVLIPKENGMHVVGKLRKIREDASKFYSVIKHLSAAGIKDLAELGLEGCFDYPKPLSLLKEIILGATFFTAREGDIILDFFAGSATTAHAVMQLNAEDGGDRRYIMVQLPEPCAKSSKAYKAGYKTVADIGKERIRRAGTQILARHPELQGRLDVGFRVLKLDSSNMKDVCYTPGDYRQENLLAMVEHIKPDRTPEDLLFQVMLDLGVPPSGRIERQHIAGKEVFSAAGGYLMACFDSRITLETIKEIAKRQPSYAVFCDAGLADDGTAASVEHIFNAYSPGTKVKVL